ncbi:MAG: hypothetical protein M1305_03215 [Candidatus Marsarchaeota archaeon]|nr:hypothetical protein [Candidatus Marsarchaeota archaeon]
MRASFDLADNDTDQDAVWAVQAPTGIGKTRAILGAEEAVIATPNHFLADELASDIREAGYGCWRIGGLPPYETEFDAEVARLRKIGAHERVARKVQAEVKRIRRVIPERQRKSHHQALLSYAAAKQKYRDDTLTAVVTHELALWSQPTRRNRMIFDEDPVRTSMAIGSVALSELVYIKTKALGADLAVKTTLDAIIDEVLAGRNGVFQDMPAMLPADSATILDKVYFPEQELSL